MPAIWNVLVHFSEGGGGDGNDDDYRPNKVINMQYDHKLDFYKVNKPYLMPKQHEKLKNHHPGGHSQHR